MTRRPGMSLTEVLVALFILTLGVIGILTMFPLGAAQMAMAVRDDRSALAANNADGIMRWYWQTYVVGAGANNPAGFIDSNFQPGTGLFDNNPLAPLSTGNASGQQVYQNWGEMSYPVLVDPIGYYARQGTFGEAPGTRIPRCTLAGLLPTASNTPLQPPVNGLAQQYHLTNFPLRICSLMDTTGFNENGTPTPDLELRYNWMWVLQRPQFINLNSTTYNPSNLFTVNMTVVVFDRRAFGFPGPFVSGYEVAIPNVSFTSGSTAVTITTTEVNEALDLKPGSWVMDATIAAPANQLPYRNANFYRVVSVVPISATQVNLELQTPIAPPTGYPPMGFTYTGTLVALRGVSGVFVRPPLVARSN